MIGGAKTNSDKMMARAENIRPTRTKSGFLRKCRTVFAPEAQRTLAGGGTTGKAGVTIRPAPKGRQISFVCRPSGAGIRGCLISWWFHHRLISGVPPGRNPKPLEHGEKCSEFMGRSFNSYYHREKNARWVST